MNRTQINSDLIKNEEIKTEDLADGSVTSAKLNIDANVNFNGNRIVNLGTPIQQEDAVNKQYVDNLINGLSWQKPVKQIITTFLPNNPSVGDRYLINISNSLNINKIAEWDGTQWIYYTPEDNWTVVVSDEDKAYTYNSELSDPFKWVLLSNNITFPEGTVNQVLRHNGTIWVATSAMVIKENGYVGIGNNNPSEKLEVNGNIKFNNSLICVNGIIKYDSDNKWKYSNDGVNFNEIGQGIEQGTSLPTPSATYRGKLFYLLGGSNESDKLYCCMKDEIGNYSWILVAVG
ncbi:MAG: hypothetical protein QXY18_01085 [Nitrososphaerota archaeon]